jgi:hypothetical protein
MEKKDRTCKCKEDDQKKDLQAPRRQPFEGPCQDQKEHGHKGGPDRHRDREPPPVQEKKDA